VPQLHERGDVEDVVESAVAGAGESRWRIWAPEEASSGSGAGPGREVVAVGEGAHVTDIGQDPGGAGGPDPGQVHQVRPRGTHRRGQLGFECLEAGVEADQIGELVGSQPPHGRRNTSRGRTPAGTVALSRRR
jgi:hypothetical protein